MHTAFCLLLEHMHAEPRDSPLSAWSQVRICFITHDMWYLSPLIFPLLLGRPQSQVRAAVFCLCRAGLGSDISARGRESPVVARPL